MFAVEFVSTVDADRSRLIALGVKTFLLAVENVVSSDSDQESSGVSAGVREIFGADGIYLLGFCGIRFTAVNVSPCRAINDSVRTLCSDYRFNRRGVGNI